MTRPAGESVPKAMQATYDAIVARTDQFCRERLNEEYAQRCRETAAALCRKRPSPLLGGNPSTWAAAIVHTIGSINFLFDKDNPLYMSAADLAAAFGLAKSTVGGKSAAIRTALNLGGLDWHWALPSKQDSYPGAWLIQVNGLIVDARTMPREIPEEAYRKGYIPRVP